ncbi:FMN-dependent NADH-azoreductase, partial [Pseudonocardia zijingensis]
MALLRVDSSIRHDGSVSRELTGAVERAWRAAGPGGDVVHRDLAADPRLTGAWPQRSSVAAALADEVLAADAVVVGAPMYNFGIPAVVKSWIDLLIVDPRFDPRRTPPGTALDGVPVVLAVACGGGYGAGSPREGWDHATPYLRRIFADLFGADVTLLVAELTAAADDPALAELRHLAERS